MADDKRIPLEARISQETLVSLEPIPIVDGSQQQTEAGGVLSSLAVEKDVASEENKSSHGDQDALVKDAIPALSLGLSGSGHGAVYYLSRVQRYSSYAFTIFSSVHFVTTAAVPLISRSVPASESYLLLAREIYQTRVSEPVLVIIPIAAHVIAGVGQRLVRRAQNLHRYGGAAPSMWLDAEPTIGLQRGAQPIEWWRRLQYKTRRLADRLCSGWPPMSIISTSGYAFLAGLGVHVTVNRIIPLAVGGDSADIGLAYVAHGFSRHPVTAWLSYTVFLGVASGHMVWGCARWLNIAQRASWSGQPYPGRQATGSVGDKATRKRRRRTWLAIQGGVLLAFGTWAAGGLGVVARGGKAQGWVAKVYDGLFDKARLWIFRL